MFAPSRHRWYLDTPDKKKERHIRRETSRSESLQTSNFRRKAGEFGRRMKGGMRIVSFTGCCAMQALVPLPIMVQVHDGGARQQATARGPNRAPGDGGTNLSAASTSRAIARAAVLRRSHPERECGNGTLRSSSVFHSPLHTDASQATSLVLPDLVDLILCRGIYLVSLCSAFPGKCAAAGRPSSWSQSR